MEERQWTASVWGTVYRIQERIAKVADGSWPDGLRTGLTDLDNVLGGFRPGSLSILAARPGIGKTALALNIAHHVAVEENQKTLYVSMTEGADEIAWRLICSMVRVNSWRWFYSMVPVESRRMRVSPLTKDESERVCEAAKRLKESPLYLCDGCGLTFDEIDMEIFRLHDWTPEADDAKQPKLAVIDSLEELSVGDDYIDEVPEYVPEESSKVVYIVERLRKTAEFQKIAILLLAGLSEDVDRRRGHRPRASDLTHFHHVAKYADTLLLLHRQGYYRRSCEERGDEAVAELTIPINRLGRTGKVSLKFDQSCMRFDYHDGSLPV